MKNRLLLLICVSSILVFSCKKDENKIYFQGGTAPVLTASSTSVTLEPGTEANTALLLNWTNPDYMFTTGVSSQDVTYTIEMDTAGANFASSKKISTVVSKDLSKTYTVGQLNANLGNDMQLQLDPRRDYTIELRVLASLGSNAKLTSNTVSFATKPFAPPPKVVPPANGTLWITGDAVSGPGYTAWSNPLVAPYDANFQFTKKSSTLYELTLAMPGGGGYKLIQINGDWSTQYHMTDGTWEGGNMEKKDSDPQFPGPPTAGTYKITADFQTGKFKVVKL